MAGSLSNRPWDGSPSRYASSADYADACLVNENTGPRSQWVQAKAHLPIQEPSGDYNRAAMGAAAAALVGGRGGVTLPPAVKKAAARKLASIYARFNLPIPPSLKNMAM